MWYDDDEDYVPMSDSTANLYPPSAPPSPPPMTVHEELAGLLGWGDFRSTNDRPDCECMEYPCSFCNARIIEHAATEALREAGYVVLWEDTGATWWLVLTTAHSEDGCLWLRLNDDLDATTYPAALLEACKLAGIGGSHD
jgi:hypothetical protein